MIRFRVGRRLKVKLLGYLYGGRIKGGLKIEFGGGSFMENK